MTNITTWPAAAGTTTDAYTVKADGVQVPVMGTPMPENRIVEARRHPYSFALFDADGEVTVEVSSRWLAMDDVAILPESKGVKPLEIRGHTVVFRATPPFTLAVEPRGRHDALILAANLPETDAPQPDAPGVVFFGPGRHHPERIELKDGETLYLAGGAWVEGGVFACGDNVTIRDCFIRVQDDCITPKWWCEDLLVERCTLWTDIANAFRIGYECEDPPYVYRNLVFRDIDVLHLTLKPTTPDQFWANAAIYIQAANEQLLENFVFEDIRFHEVNRHDIFLLLKTMATDTCKKSTTAGYFKHLAMRNIHLPDSNGGMCVYISTHDEAHYIDGVSFENVTGYGEVTQIGAVRNGLLPM